MVMVNRVIHCVLPECPGYRWHKCMLVIRSIVYLSWTVAGEGMVAVFLYSKPITKITKQNLMGT